MTTTQEYNKFEQLVQRIHPENRLLRTWKLTGGVSAQVTALEVLQADGQTKKMIVRQHGEVDRKRNPHIAADEFRLLQMLQLAGLPAPVPYYLDQAGEIFSEPSIVIQFIEGQPEFSPTPLTDFILQLTSTLANIHRVDTSGFDRSFLPRQEKTVSEKLDKPPATVDESLNKGPIRDTLQSVWPLPQRNQSVLLHGDFWPGNLLWKDRQLVAVIDWEDAALGDPLADVANSRLEILWTFGSDAMNHFTQQYRMIMPTIDFTNLPYWDLYAALRLASNLSQWGLDDVTEKRMRDRHQWFVKQAFAKRSPV